VTDFVFNRDYISLFCAYINRDILNNSLKKSIHELGPKYTPDANVETKITKILNAFVFSNKFQREFDEFLNTLEEKTKQLKNKEEVYLNANTFKDIKKCLENFILKSKDESNKEYLNKFAKELILEIWRFNDNLIYFNSNNEEITNEESINCRQYTATFDFIREFFIDDIEIVLNNNVLIVEGEAGIGKSHTIADFLLTLENECICILELGQFFINESEDPWCKIIRKLGFSIGKNEFFNNLRKYSDLYGKQVVLAIDALNEGKGCSYWKNHLRGLVFECMDNNIKLILTVRSEYKDLIFKKDLLENKNISLIQHNGFMGFEQAAIKRYCQFYGFVEPVFLWSLIFIGIH
ncbi:MAG: hypothetical protein Q4C49_12490, partial [Bacillota bacterium]|nr:hypothetical protein [Bacillota bacterium]